MVAGSSGAFFHVADLILKMDCYHTLDITEEVKRLCREYPAPVMQADPFAKPDYERVLPAFTERKSSDKSSGNRRRPGTDSRHEHMKIKTNGLDSLSLNRETVDVRYLEQLSDTEQTTALAYLLRYGLEQVLDGKKTVRQAVCQIYDALVKNGWSSLCGSYVPCGLAKPRIQELYACLNRFRG